MGASNKYRSVIRGLQNGEWSILDRLQRLSEWSIGDMVSYGLAKSDGIDEVLRSDDPSGVIDGYHRAVLRVVKERGYERIPPHGDRKRKQYLLPQAEARRIVETDLAHRFSLRPEDRLINGLTPIQDSSMDFGPEGRQPPSYLAATKLDVAVLTFLLRTIITLVDKDHRSFDVDALRQDLVDLGDLGSAMSYDEILPENNFEVAQHLVGLLDRLEDPESYLVASRPEDHETEPRLRSTQFDRKVKRILQSGQTIFDVVQRYIPDSDPYPHHPGRVDEDLDSEYPDAL